ncbi:cysteine-rich domain protein [Thermanaeromonas sp. C210]|nr:cysteine-rich domain protein [Thermanaeromonas sp. C210]
MALKLRGESSQYRLPPTVEVVRGNIIKYGNPLGLSGKEIAGWASDLNLPREGEVLLYTGGEYQLVPYIDGLVDMLTKVDQGSVGFSLMMGFRNLVDRVGVNPEKIVAGVLSGQRERYRNVSRQAAAVLQRMGLQICYLGEEELYSGALLYEYGFMDDLRRHARKLAGLIKGTGARTIICLSPHSAEVFKLIYPRIIEDFHYEVKTFTEALWDLCNSAPGRLVASFNGRVTVHDSCRMARELGITEEIREIFKRIKGVSLIEPEFNRRWTTCCGGPGKVLFPELAGKIAARRLDELMSTEADVVVTFCPYCLAALDKARREGQRSIEIQDIIEFMYRGMAE